MGFLSMFQGGGGTSFQESSDARSGSKLTTGPVNAGDFNVSTGGLNLGSSGVLIFAGIAVLAIVLLFVRK
jgi:hypothetical protein